MGKTGRKNRVYSAEFKTSVIMDMRENYLSHRETVRKYWNTQNRTEEDKYLRTLRNWEWTIVNKVDRKNRKIK